MPTLEATHLARVSATGGQLADAAYVTAAVALLRQLNLTAHVVHWSDARFGVALAGSKVTRLYSLLGPDAEAIPGVAGPEYVATGYGGGPELRYDNASLRVPLLDLSRTDQYTTVWLGQQRAADTLGFFYELSADYNQGPGGFCALIENKQLETAHRTTDYVVLRDTEDYQQQPLYVVTRGDFARSSEEITTRMNDKELSEYSYGGTPYNRDTTGRLPATALYLGSRGGSQYYLRDGLLNSLLILDVAVSEADKLTLQRFLQQRYAAIVVPQAGLHAWFQADWGVTVDEAGQVTQWKDRGPHHLDVAPVGGSASVSPEQLNGHPMLRVNGRLASTALVTITGNQARSVYFLGRLVEGNVIVSWGEPDTGLLFECAQENNSPLIHAYGGGMDNWYTLADQPVYAPALWTWRYDGNGGGYSEFNDQRGGKGGPPYMDTRSTPLSLAWGGFYATYGTSVVDICEVLVYDRMLTGEEHELVRNYLRSKGAV